ncbi:protein FAR1-RELATED SEQUENCE 5-like [Silene latifolia]|uniref:protein FAR1-RELATED SEQUENCE 5-like n=1 Tax=Silene latifolia TaxID=37657 RepID=UPI003D76BED1
MATFMHETMNKLDVTILMYILLLTFVTNNGNSGHITDKRMVTFMHEAMNKPDVTILMYILVITFNLIMATCPHVYPTSRHRLCQWRIQQNAISHFGKLKGNRPFQNLFNKCLNDCYNESGFEETWCKMLKDYGLEGHSWFKRLYKHIVKWSTALNNEYFSARILSSQKSESTNHAMSFQASKTTSVTAFFGIFETTVKRWRSEEERKEFNGIISMPTSVYPLADLLLHASQVYTVELFHIFEREFALVMGTRATFLPVDDPLLVYYVQPADTEEGAHHVTYDCSNQLIECTCQKFQVMEARFVFEKLCVKANEEVQSLLSKVTMDEDLRNEESPNVELIGPPILDLVYCTTKGRSARKKESGAKEEGQESD